jgi:four helix bundle protein
MATELEDLKVLQDVEEIADSIWRDVLKWDKFARDVVGKQMARAGDSIGANIAESYGRYHYGEKLNFLYYARGSLFETKYWLNRALTRSLFPKPQVDKYSNQLSQIARLLNSFAKNLKSQKYKKASASTIREPDIEYFTDKIETGDLFNQDELDWLLTYSTQLPQSPVSSPQSPQKEQYDR